MRRGSRTAPFPRAFARFNRRIANPVIRRFAGRLPPLALLTHRGRATGRHYATPVVAFRARDGLVVGVMYGTDSDWVKNVLAEGGAGVTRLGRMRRYARPRLVGRDEGLRLVHPALRGPLRALGVQHFMRLATLRPERSV